MNEQQLRTEAQARRLALFLESALRGDDGWWLPRDRMVHRIRQTATQWALGERQELAAWRFLFGVARAADMELEPISDEVWFRVADLLEAGAPTGVLDEPATDPLPETGEPRGSTQAQAPTGHWLDGYALNLPCEPSAWTDADDALLAEWLDEQNGETT